MKPLAVAAAELQVLAILAVLVAEDQERVMAVVRYSLDRLLEGMVILAVMVVIFKPAAVVAAPVVSVVQQQVIM